MEMLEFQLLYVFWVDSFEAPDKADSKFSDILQLLSVKKKKTQDISLSESHVIRIYG